MIFRIFIAAAVVIACFAMPTLVDSEYTEITSLLEDGILSGIVIVLMLTVVKGVAAIIICIIEAFLIGIAAYYGFNFEQRHTLYFAINYTALHQGAFWLELAIITARIITGYREIGADYSRIVASHSVPFFDRRHRERDQ